MKNALKFIRVAFLVLAWCVWWFVPNRSHSIGMNWFLIVGLILLIIPIIWLARWMLDRHPTIARSDWITTFVHYAVGIQAGTAVIQAVLTRQAWQGWVLPVPVWIGLVLVIVSGVATLLSVANLALKGLGAPFVIALSQKVAADWMYAWTRNPMMLGGLALLASLGIWFQSLFFVLWALVVVTPVMLFFLKVYEERELEVRFGESYLEYKAKTPMLFPRKPKE
jgi:protein-S-isoprenylcysteine O-methyltransferase Ste14